jgi:hypothetical protein
MRYALICVVLVGCATKTVTVTPSAADDTDARICAAAEQVPWQGPTIAALVQSGQGSEIQTEAQAKLDADESGSGNESVAAWNTLTATCVSSGY